MNLSLYLNKCQNLLTFPAQLQSPSAWASSRGAQGGSGDFWVWEGAAEILGCICYMARSDEEEGRVAV